MDKAKLIEAMHKAGITSSKINYVLTEVQKEELGATDQMFTEEQIFEALGVRDIPGFFRDMSLYQPDGWNTPGLIVHYCPEEVDDPGYAHGRFSATNPQLQQIPAE